MKAAALVLAFLVVSGSAQAAQITRQLTYRAAPGEANRVTVTRKGDDWTFADAGAPLTTTERCDQLDEHTVRCLDFPTLSLDLRLGDGDDTADLAHAGDSGAVVYGGTGSDVLVGSPGGDFLGGGGGGRDTLVGLAGIDRMTDGDTDADHDADAFDGGGSDGGGLSGNDRVSYGRRSQDLVVDLAAGHGGAAGEEDTYAGVEDVQGGRGDDRLTGTGDDNTLDGGQGDDVLESGGGDDVLDGGKGADVVGAGPGNDLLYVNERSSFPADRVACGAGRDTVVHNNLKDILSLDCDEVYSEPGLVFRARPALVGRELRVRLTCETIENDPRCFGRLALRLPGHPVAFAAVRYDIPGRKRPAVVAIPLSPAALRTLREAPVVAIRSTVGSGTSQAQGGFSIETALL